MYKGNKGEWSELYTLLKIMGDGFIVGADENLNKIDDWKYPVEKILHETCSNESLIYEINHELGIVKMHVNNTLFSSDTKQDRILESAFLLLRHIQKQQKSAFEIPELEKFWNEILLPKMKAGSASKRDITLVIRDFKNRLEKEVGFSIKSKLGGASTLFNAGETNFEYEVVGVEKLSGNLLEHAQSLKAGTLVKWLYANGCSLVYKKTKNQKFLNNLLIIDSMLDQVMASLTLMHYRGLGSVVNLVKAVEEINPCGYPEDTVSNFYQYKVKQFLSAAALGMTAQCEWTGIIDATGGYIVVKEDGELVCYHIYNWNALQTYLYNSTRLETASTSRYGFGKLYEQNGKHKLDLNLQVRFL